IAVEFIPPTSLALTRFLLASLSFLIVDLYLFIQRRQRGEETSKTIERRSYTKLDWIYLGIASFSGTSLFFALQYAAIELIGPSLPALFVCLLAPVLITVLAVVFFNERLTKFKIIGYVIATVGGFLLVTGGDLRTLTLKFREIALNYINISYSYFSLSDAITNKKYSFIHICSFFITYNLLLTQLPGQ
ncbi:unnamed protein product, partial [marine sediment metagenome]